MKLIRGKANRYRYLEVNDGDGSESHLRREANRDLTCMYGLIIVFYVISTCE